MKTRIHRPKNRSRRYGGTIVEFAIVAPIFFILLLGAFEFSRLHMIRSTASNAAYEAARVSMVPGATAAEATAEANRIMGLLGTRNATVTITPNVVTETTDQITVNISIPFSDNAYLIPTFVGGMNIVTQSTLKLKGIADHKCHGTFDNIRATETGILTA